MNSERRIGAGSPMMIHRYLWNSMDILGYDLVWYFTNNMIWILGVLLTFSLPKWFTHFGAKRGMWMDWEPRQVNESMRSACELKRNQCRALSMLFYEMWVLFFPILFHCSTMFGLDVALRSSTKNQKDLGNPHSWKSCCRGKTIQISTVLLRVFTGKHQNIPVGWSSAVCSQRFWPPDREVREIVMWGFSTGWYPLVMKNMANWKIFTHSFNG